jgi:anti-sigma B factor antagonist
LGLQISSRQSGDVLVLDLQGRATIGRSNEELSTQLRGLIDAGNRKILVNLSGVSQIDSSGISTIVRSFVTIRRHGGILKLVHATGHVYEVLELTRLIQTIPSFNDEPSALASFT